jgi:hypothetical protein
MEKAQTTKGPKPVTVSLYPLLLEKALDAFMRIDLKKVKRREKKRSRWKQ